MNLSFINLENKEKFIGELIDTKFKENTTAELPFVVLLLRLN